MRRLKKFKEIVNLNYIYKNKLDKAYFAHDAVCADYKDFSWENCFRQDFKR